jgi:hypothetical protein
MVDAIKRILATVKESGGITGFFVDSKNEQAQRFYLRYGFISLQDAPLTMFLPLKTLLNGLEKLVAR